MIFTTTTVSGLAGNARQWHWVKENERDG